MLDNAAGFQFVSHLTYTDDFLKACDIFGTVLTKKSALKFCLGDRALCKKRT